MTYFELAYNSFHCILQNAIELGIKERKLWVHAAASQEIMNKEPKVQPKSGFFNYFWQM